MKIGTVYFRYLGIILVHMPCLSHLVSVEVSVLGLGSDLLLKLIDAIL